MPEKEIVIDLSKKISWGNNRYISIGSFLLSFLIALLEFIIALNLNNWVANPSCWVVFLNFIYAVRSGQDYSNKTGQKVIDTNTVAENRALIQLALDKISQIEKEKKLITNSTEDQDSQ